MAPGVSTGRTNPLVQPKNLAVPGATVQDALSTRPTCIPGSPTITDLVLGLPAPCLGLGLPLSQVEWAEALHPTTVIVWLGSEDALKAVFSGTSAALTPPSSFATAYAEVMVRLAGTGAKLVAANVPDVTDIPYLPRLLLPPICSGSSPSNSSYSCSSLELVPPICSLQMRLH